MPGLRASACVPRLSDPLAHESGSSLTHSPFYSSLRLQRPIPYFCRLTVLVGPTETIPSRIPISIKCAVSRSSFLTLIAVGYYFGPLYRFQTGHRGMRYPPILQLRVVPLSKTIHRLLQTLNLQPLTLILHQPWSPAPTAISIPLFHTITCQRLQVALRVKRVQVFTLRSLAVNMRTLTVTVIVCSKSPPTLSSPPQSLHVQYSPLSS